MFEDLLAGIARLISELGRKSLLDGQLDKRACWRSHGSFVGVGLRPVSGVGTAQGSLR
jgi:hypothetical protein